MPMKRLIILVCIVAGGWAIFQYYVCNTYIYDRDIAKQEPIADAYVKFYVARHAFPSSLRDLVEGGFLPAKGRYREPPGFWDSKVEFMQGSYEVFPPRGGDPATLSMLGLRNPSGSWTFNSTINATIRDRVLPTNLAGGSAHAP